jgi:hypothetical protein
VAYAVLFWNRRIRLRLPLPPRWIALPCSPPLFRPHQVTLLLTPRPLPRTLKASTSHGIPGSPASLARCCFGLRWHLAT